MEIQQDIQTSSSWLDLKGKGNIMHTQIKSSHTYMYIDGCFTTIWQKGELVWKD